MGKWRGLCDGGSGIDADSGLSHGGIGNHPAGLSPCLSWPWAGLDVFQQKIMAGPYRLDGRFCDFGDLFLGFIVSRALYFPGVYSRFIIRASDIACRPFLSAFIARVAFTSIILNPS